MLFLKKLLEKILWKSSVKKFSEKQNSYKFSNNYIPIIIREFNF